MARYQKNNSKGEDEKPEGMINLSYAINGAILDMEPMMTRLKTLIGQLMKQGNFNAAVYVLEAYKASTAIHKAMQAAFKSYTENP